MTCSCSNAWLNLAAGNQYDLRFIRRLKYKLHQPVVFRKLPETQRE